MITDSFDSTAPVISPGSFYGPRQQLCDLCIATFSHVILANILAEFPCEEIAEIGSVNGPTPVYRFSYADKRIGVYLSPIGAALSGGDVVEVNWMTGAEKFILFGSAGSLNSGLTTGNYVIPTEAYRDEGMSYHYAPPENYIRIPNAERLDEIFTELGLPHVMGRVWTTDAVFRETAGQVAARQVEGCIAVDMELAGVQAVCSYHGFQLYHFLVTGDMLDLPKYRVGTLHNANHALDKFYIALEIAKRI